MYILYNESKKVTTSVTDCHFLAGTLLCVIALQSNLPSPFVASREDQKQATLFPCLAFLPLEHHLLCITGLRLRETPLFQ